MFQEGYLVERIKSREELRVMVLTSVFVLGIIFVFLFYIYQRVEVREKIYAINQMQEEQRKLIEENRNLQLEVASLRSLDRIERIATEQLGLCVPKDVRMLK